MNVDPAAPSLRGRILVVDDSPTTLTTLCEVLVEEHEVLFATTGTEALEVAHDQEPDLILLDVVMPGMDGYEVCTRLKASTRTADIPVLFITSLGEEPDQSRAFAAGGIDFLQKPINPVLVKARVRNHLELKRRQDALKGLSVRDALTGIPNRRHFDETLREEWMRGVRNQKPLSLIMMDLDHFKLFNDTYGHAAGDNCLKRVAETLQKSLQRPVDLVARVGGEEFVCLLPETELRGAVQVAERFREAVAALALPHAKSPTAAHVSMSLGVATLLPVAEGHPESLLLEADRCLYEAKGAGRNRIAQAGTGSPAAGVPVAGRPLVLLVEDDKHMRALLAERLSFLEASVETVPSAPEALSFLARSKAQLVLSDVVMPGIDGFTLCQRLKEDPARRGIPFVLLTSLSRNLRERAAQVGADDHLSKLEEDAVFRMRIRFLLELGVLPPSEPPEGGSILLLSPSQAVRTQFRMHLQPAGMRVRDGASLEEALDSLGQEPPELLSLDLDPSLGDPGDILRRLREVPGCGDRPVVLLAAKAEEGPLARLEAQAQDRLPKPLEAQEVRHRVRLLLRLARARKAACAKV
ncbi:MAG: diguanylate cyclase [Acidobacteria bacterium]|nr:diguanylate cyclase [Acidobacteriota bacterium]